MLKPARLLFATALLLPLVTRSAHAQTSSTPAPSGQQGMGQGRGMGGERRFEELLKGITLTADQQKKIDSIRAAYRARMPAFTPGQMPDSATRAQGRNLMRAANQEIRDVLDMDQRKIWDQNVETMRANRGRMGGGPN
ncbi:MAG TPA: hypothetical protein VMJ30_02535 [Gemmatimonadales bacterium]|nr:hypothetical protein [Gemmatimonadales bacterium]